jgi:hypothetical protein
VISEPLKEEMKFLKTAAYNRGIQVEMFDTIEVALIWLKS